MAERTREHQNSAPATGKGQSTDGVSLEEMQIPQDLRTYEDVAPGSAAKFVEEYFAEQAHRRELALRQVRTRARFDAFVLVVVAVITLGVFGASVWLATGGGAKVPGTILGILDLVGAFTMLIFRRERT